METISITKYKTKDGKLFDNEKEATAYETKLNMPNGNLSILKEYNEGVNFEEALALSKQSGKLLPTNLQMDAILQNEGLRNQYSKVLPCWTGDIAIYEMPNTPFKDYIKDPQSGWVFDIPKQYQGKKDIVLILQQKYYKLEKGKYDMKCLKATKVNALQFPTKNGWYLPDPKFGIPTGKEVDPSNLDARYLYRTTDSDPICPLVCGGSWDWYSRRDVNAEFEPANGFGVGVVGLSQTKPKGLAKQAKN